MNPKQILDNLDEEKLEKILLFNLILKTSTILNQNKDSDETRRVKIT